MISIKMVVTNLNLPKNDINFEGLEVHILNF
jgi:hypothetical protein